MMCGEERGKNAGQSKQRFFKFFLKKYLYLHECVCIFVHVCRHLGRAEAGISSLEVELWVTGRHLI